MNCWTICDQTWYADTPLVDRLSLEDNRWVILRIWTLVSICPSYMFWTTELFATKIDMMAYHHRTKCHVKRWERLYSWWISSSNHPNDHVSLIFVIIEPFVPNLVYWCIIADWETREESELLSTSRGHSTHTHKVWIHTLMFFHQIWCAGTSLVGGVLLNGSGCCLQGQGYSEIQTFYKIIVL